MSSLHYNRCNGTCNAALRSLVCRLNGVNDDFCYLALAIAVVVFGWRHVVMGYGMGLNYFRLSMIYFYLIYCFRVFFYCRIAD